MWRGRLKPGRVSRPRLLLVKRHASYDVHPTSLWAPFLGVIRPTLVKELCQNMLFRACNSIKLRPADTKRELGRFFLSLFHLASGAPHSTTKRVSRGPLWSPL